IERIRISNIELTNTVLSGQVNENNLDMGLWIKDSEAKDRYHLGARMEVNENNYSFSLFEDGLMLNYDQWNISPDNRIVFGSAGVSAYNFRLTHEGQELYVQSQDSTVNAPIDIRFDNFRIETLSEMLESETLNVGGGINGTATISRLDTNPVFVSDLEIRDFLFGQQPIGNVLIKVNNEKENT